MHISLMGFYVFVCIFENILGHERSTNQETSMVQLILFQNHYSKKWSPFNHIFMINWAVTPTWFPSKKKHWKKFITLHVWTHLIDQKSEYIGLFSRVLKLSWLYQNRWSAFEPFCQLFLNVHQYYTLPNKCSGWNKLTRDNYLKYTFNCRLRCYGFNKCAE